MDDLVLVILSIQFVFDWVVATIVGVTWCYLFKLAAPTYSNTLLGWSLYTLLMILLMPLLRMWLLKQLHMEDDSEPGGGSPTKRLDDVQKKALQGWRLLLSATCGTAVGTSLLGLCPLLLPRWSNLNLPGGVGFSFAVVCTAIYIFIQARMERRLHVGSSTRDGYISSLYSTLLMSTWSTLGFFWNIVWTRVLDNIQLWVAPGSLSPHHSHEFRPMQTLMDMLFGRPLEMERGMEDLALKAVVTVVLALVVLVLLPEPPPLGEETTIALHLRRRALLGSQMVLLTLAAYAVTDVGFYSGTRFVAAWAGSEQIGLAVAFLYAFLVTCLAIGVGVIYRFRPRTNLGKWMSQMGCFFVCYAWWYCWQELLFQIQSFYIDELSWTSLPLAFERIFIAITFTALLTLLFSYAMVEATQYRIMRARAELRDKNKDEISELLSNETFASNSLRFFAACSGLLVAASASDDNTEDDDDKWRGVGYGAYGAFDESSPAALADSAI